jgi:hypothetical protein
LLIGIVGLVAPAAVAQTPPSTATGIPQSEIDKCIGDQPIGVAAPPACVFDSSGHLISRTPSTPGSTGSGINLEPFIVALLLWSVLPFAIAVALARGRHESIGRAVLLTLFLGWIGLLIVAFGQRRTATELRDLAGRPSTQEP